MTNMDPCWLPSAIMQTTGAILGIFVAIYVLALPRLLELTKALEPNELINKLGDKEGKEHIDRGFDALKGLKIFNVCFILLIIFCCLTIIFSTLWLDSLTTNVLITNSIFLGLTLGFLATCLFLFSVIFICVYSILIIYFVLYWLSPIKGMYKL